MRPSFYIETYGCWLNVGDSQIMARLLEEAGFSRASIPQDAFTIIVNTCAVRAGTERKMLRRLRELAPLAQRRGAKLVVAGCLAAYRPALVARVVPDASLLATDAIELVVEAASSRRGFYAGSGVRRWMHLPCLKAGGRIVVPIAVGCLGSCAYCVEPLTRGGLRSYPPAEIVARVKEGVEGGAKEVFLVAQDAAAYGLDIGSSLPSLLKEVCKVKGEFMVRVGMMEPSLTMKILDDLLEAYEDPKVYRFLHLPLQSGSDEVLRKVGRQYTVESFLEVVRAYRSRFPEGCLATDVMVGLPGESEEGFQATLKVIEAVEPDKVHVARFTPRPLTPAASMKAPPEWVKKARSRAVSKLAAEVALKRNERWLGREVEVLTTTYVNGTTICRSRNYKPVVVGGRLEPWSWVRVKVTSAHPHYLKASTNWR